MTGSLDPRGAWTGERCTIAKALDVVATRSAFLILREAFYGTTRLDDFAKRVGVDNVPRGAPELHGDWLAAPAVAQLDRSAAVVEPPVAPLHQRDQGGKQVGALFCEPIALAGSLPRFAVVLAFEQPVVDELP